MTAQVHSFPRAASVCPDPLVPVGLVFPASNVMPVDRRWIRDPARRATWRPEDWLAALTLRAASLEQSPPASLPSDNDALAVLAGWAENGRKVDDWPEARKRALDDWVPCSDGRLYQPGIAEWVLEMWLAFDVEDRAAGAGADDEAHLDAQVHLDRLQQDAEAAGQADANRGVH